jgi:P4 family phage/plasmid primase-like protien
MTMEEIRDWISYVLAQRSRNWLGDPVDPAGYKKHGQVYIPHSDLNSAREIYATFEHLVHYVPGSNAWHVWNGVFHEKIDGDLLSQWMTTAYVDVHKAALEQVKAHFKAESDQMSKADDRTAHMKLYEKIMFKEHRDYRDRIHSNGGLQGLNTQVKQIFSVPDNFFGDDRRWLVLLNGVIDLYDLRARPVRPGDLQTLYSRLLDHDPARPVYRAVDAELRPWADSSRWRNFLETSLPDPELRKFLAVVTGAAFFGEAKTKIIPILKGEPDSGKTIYIDTIDALAAGYGGQPDTSSINRVSGPNFEQDQFRGLRFAGVTEPNTDRKVDDSFLKKFTGGDILSTRNLHARSVEWKSQGILFIATNKDLKFDTDDTAIMQRFATVPFPHQFFPKGQVPEGKEEFEQDLDLGPDLLADLDGILSWVLNGMLVYIDEGIDIPTAVERERERLHVEGNSAISWMINSVENNEQAFVVDPNPKHPKRNKTDFVALNDAHVVYCSWVVSDLGDDAPLDKRAFRAAIEKYLGVEIVKSGAWRIPGLVYRDRLQADELSSIPAQKVDIDHV